MESAIVTTSQPPSPLSRSSGSQQGGECPGLGEPFRLSSGELALLMDSKWVLTESGCVADADGGLREALGRRFAWAKHWEKARQLSTGRALLIPILFAAFLGLLSWGMFRFPLEGGASWLDYLVFVPLLALLWTGVLTGLCRMVTAWWCHRRLYVTGLQPGRVMRDVSQDPPSRDRLVALLSSPNPEVQRIAVACLSGTGNPSDESE